MTYYEDTRKLLMTTAKAFHDANFPTLEVNYPDLWITDVESVGTEPFAAMEFNVVPEHLDISARRCIRAKGQVIYKYYWRVGQGLKSSGEYTDSLFNYLGLKTIDGVTYYEVVPYENILIPGFNGVSNIVRYEVEYYNV